MSKQNESIPLQAKILGTKQPSPAFKGTEGENTNVSHLLFVVRLKTKAQRRAYFKPKKQTNKQTKSFHVSDVDMLCFSCNSTCFEQTCPLLTIADQTNLGCFG